VIPPVGAEYADPAEPDGLVAANRPRVRRDRVDDEPVVALVLEQVPGGRADRVLAEPLSVECRIEEEVEAGVPVLRVFLRQSARTGLDALHPNHSTCRTHRNQRYVKLAFDPPLSAAGATLNSRPHREHLTLTPMSPASRLPQ